MSKNTMVGQVNVAPVGTVIQCFQVAADVTAKGLDASACDRTCVAMHVYTPVGLAVYFLSNDAAEELELRLRLARTGLIAPTGPAV